MKIEGLADNRCCGCAACANACAAGAIKMAENREGFLYPVINHELCVGCGACDRACPRLEEYPMAYAAMCNSSHIREKSSSGGIFHLLAEKILSQGGAVYGAAFDENFEVCQCRVDSIDDLEKLQGSKYVQSRIGEVFRDVKAQLATGKLILFSGTPCQCEGLVSYLGKPYKNLYVVDFICHGVPSPAVWRSYVKYVAGLKKDTQISHVFFRSKYSNDLHTDIYLRGFLKDLYLRKSCYECTSRKLHRVSDVTVADFWGIQNVLPDMYDSRGTSLVLVQSEKGRRLFDGIDARISKVNFVEAIKGNSAYLWSPAVHLKREAFFKRFEAGEELVPLLQELLKEPLINHAKNRLRSVKILRDIYHCIRK